MSKIHDIIAHLEGTCESLEAVCNYYNTSYFDLTDQELSLLNDSIGRCAKCGWWYPIEEMGSGFHGNEYCDDCEMEEEYDEDIFD